MKIRNLSLVVAGTMLATAAQAQFVSSCRVFPKNNYWNTRVDNLPPHAKSNEWVNSIGTAAKLHADWGVTEAEYGIPFITVPGNQPKVPITFHTDQINYGSAEDESDPGPYPFPANIPIEGTNAMGVEQSLDSDRHSIAIDTTNCVLYETYMTWRVNGGTSFDVYSAAKFNLNSNALRPLLWTSADAAGYAIFPGLVRYEEAASGEINHAIRFTANNVRGADPAGPEGKAFIWPARHYSTSNSNTAYPPMGARFRLKSSYVIPANFDPKTKAILRAMQRYGLFLADRGSNWFFQGVTDSRWGSVLSELSQVAGSNFEAVDTLKLRMDNDSAQSVQYQPDLNLDTNADVIFRNATSGQVYRAFGGFLSVSQGAMAYHEVDTAWQVAAEGDFNADGIRDLVWRNTGTGQVYMQPFGSNGLPAAGAIFHVEPNQAWKIVATPDIDGDGRADLVWQNVNTGHVYTMLMNGTAIKAQGTSYFEPDTQWRIVASGDFAATGLRNQLLWRHQVTGQVYLQTMTWQGGGAFASSGSLIWHEPDVANWKIVATGDINGDGRDDVIYHNSADGRVFALLVGAPGSAVFWREADTQWRIVAMGDYNGDGKADLLWRNSSSGLYYMMLLNGAAFQQGAIVWSEPNTSWTVLGPGSYVGSNVQ